MKQTRTAYLMVRVTPAEARRYRRLARQKGLSVSALVRLALSEVSRDGDRAGGNGDGGDRG